MFGNRIRTLFVDPATGPVDPIAEALLLSASRAQLVSEVIEPALAASRWVLCDRFVHSTLAYQGYGRGLDLETLRRLASFATRDTSPDVTLLVDIPVELSRKRVLTRANASGITADRVEREGVDFHERVRAGYLALAGEETRIKVLDGTLDERALLDAAWQLLAPHVAA
jgi:dTMP kinase